MLKSCLTSLMLMAAMLTGFAETPVVIAHRGASGYLPEHTIEAAVLAHGMGADYIEQDLVLSKDWVPVVLHDIHIDTVTDVAMRFPDRKRKDGRYYAIDFTLDELKQMIVYERFDPITGKTVFPDRFPMAQAVFRIATLEEQLQLIAGLNKSTGRTVGIYPELKNPAWHHKQGHDLSAVVIPMLQAYGYRSKEAKCWLQCFDLREIRRIREKLGWEGRLLLLLDRGDKTETGFQFGKLRIPEDLPELAKTIDGLGPAVASVLSADGSPTSFVADAHVQKLVVHPYTVRADLLPKGLTSLDQFHQLLLVAAGVDGLFTDFPDKTAAFVRGMKQKSE